MSKNAWFQNAINPKINLIKKFMFKILQHKYAKHEEVIERISASLVTNKDIEDFQSLIASIYENGFMNSTDQHKERLSEMGIKMTVTNGETKPESKILKS